MYKNLGLGLVKHCSGLGKVNYPRGLTLVNYCSVLGLRFGYMSKRSGLGFGLGLVNCRMVQGMLFQESWLSEIYDEKVFGLYKQ